jgi:Lhr-like helicase
MSSPSPSPPPLTAFSNPAGFALVKKTIQDTLGLEPHGYQTRGVCATLDGRNLLAIIPTGGGKTGFVYMYLRALLQLRTDPRLHEKVRKKMPERPALVYVLPTNGLEFELVRALAVARLSCSQCYNY